MGIVTSLWRRERKPAPGPIVRVVSARATPQLIVLMPDAGGIAAYQLHSFPSARAAEFYLDSTLRGKVPRGVIAFWALTEAPRDAAAESVILIRDIRRKSVRSVYPFSFADSESAYDFIRQEMMRGLQLAHVMFYWAATALIQVDVHGRAALHPAIPPEVANSRNSDQTRALTSLSAEGPAVSSQGAEQPSHLDDLDPDDLLAEDLAEVVEMMQELSGDNREAGGFPRGRIVPMPRRSRGDSRPVRLVGVGSGDDRVIDFPAASRKLQDDRACRAAATAAWANICQALDAALDVHVGRTVIARLAWARIARALVEAAATAQAIATPTVELSTEVLRRAWRNIAWTLEEAACAQSLYERSARTGTDGVVPMFSNDSRWLQRDEPFSGFNSPPGRF